MTRFESNLGWDIVKIMLSSLFFFGKDFDSSFVDLGVFNKVKNSLSHILRGGYGENVRMLHMETWCIGTCTKFET